MLKGWDTTFQTTYFTVSQIFMRSEPPMPIMKGTMVKNRMQSKTKTSAVGTAASGPIAASVIPGPM